MSWDDWSPDVKMAAAQALGTTGHAKVPANLTQPQPMSSYCILSILIYNVFLLP